ncbi:hypothetical protein LOK49_LG02G01911 [Camellia lanceoleosa]|uniref:Uncharacterized protein n=1 Tax=Camellia lanceoleosa TaxID=1840588 RepID=A0ACC0IS15_9ERIC|nr:hypothetical protein LOK49_LG02G01911 [Camellia lanceoleosa]
MLDESGTVIVFGNVVFLRPDQVVKIIQDLMPIPVPKQDDRRWKELEEMENQKAGIDRKAESLSRFSARQKQLMKMNSFDIVRFNELRRACYPGSSSSPAHGFSITPSFDNLERSKIGALIASYELPSQGLLQKCLLFVKGEDMDFSKVGSRMYDLIYASAVFLHMPDNLVWVGLERLAKKLKPHEGRIFVSHNIKFCSRLGGDECTKRLNRLRIEYIGKHTHDSLLFNHYEIWFEFRRSKV